MFQLYTSAFIHSLVCSLLLMFSSLLQVNDGINYSYAILHLCISSIVMPTYWKKTTSNVSFCPCHFPLKLTLKVEDKKHVANTLSMFDTKSWSVTLNQSGLLRQSIFWCQWSVIISKDIVPPHFSKYDNGLRELLKLLDLSWSTCFF